MTDTTHVVERTRRTTVPVVRFVVKGMNADEPCNPTGRAYTVVYDGTCTICGRLVRMLRGWDKHGVLPGFAAGT